MIGLNLFLIATEVEKLVDFNPIYLKAFQAGCPIGPEQQAKKLPSLVKTIYLTENCNGHRYLHS